jgi:Spy/CpxP family protein refolding chaperone
MDVGAFVQENKRWLAGSALGAIVWFIAGAVVDSIDDASSVRGSTRGAPSQLYDNEVLAAASTEGEQLAAERQKLQQELAFVPSQKYVLDGKGEPDTYLFQVGHALRQSILTEANAREVTVADKDVKWEQQRGPDEVRGMLFGLELMDEASKRLFAAHDAVRAARPEAMGLRTIQYLRLGSRNAQRPQRVRARARSMYARRSRRSSSSSRSRATRRSSLLSRRPAGNRSARSRSRPGRSRSRPARASRAR